jgi:type II secretion system (T2SS) protein M
MPDIDKLHRRFRLTLAVLLAICTGAAAVLLSPIGSSSRTHQQELQQLRWELQAKTAENTPLQGIDQKVISAQQEIATFYHDRLPSSYASISETLGSIASDNGVSLVTGHYKAEASGVPGLQYVTIEASITGDYPHLVKFINATERDKAFFLIDDVSLTQQQAGVIQVQIRIEAFLREA